MGEGLLPEGPPESLCLGGRGSSCDPSHPTVIPLRNGWRGSGTPPFPPPSLPPLSSTPSSPLLAAAQPLGPTDPPPNTPPPGSGWDLNTPNSAAVHTVPPPALSVPPQGQPSPSRPHVPPGSAPACRCLAAMPGAPCSAVAEPARPGLAGCRQLFLAVTRTLPLASTELCPTYSRLHLEGANASVQCCLGWTAAGPWVELCASATPNVARMGLSLRACIVHKRSSSPAQPARGARWLRDVTRRPTVP